MGKKDYIIKLIMNWRETINWGNLPLRVSALIIAGMIILFVLFDWVTMPTVTRHGKERTVPSVMGMDLEEAKTTLRKSRLKLVVLAEKSDAGKRAGMILIQSPEAGKVVKQGRGVKVIISKGGEKLEIPDLAGVSLRQAELTLSGKKLEIGDISWILSDSLPENVVVSSTPSAGSIVPEGISVNLLVSQGRLYDVVMMPKLVGKNLQQAQNIADSLKLEVDKVRFVHRDDLLPGIVVHQTPQSGTKLDTGADIVLEVSSTE